jgi:hypothetical protein
MRPACCIFVTSLAVCLFCGCRTSTKKPAPPEITVECLESADASTRVVVRYLNCDFGNGNPPNLVLTTPDQLAAYKKQVEFLLNRLEEAEKRMKVHEPKVEK